MATQEAVMTTKDVANRFSQLAKENDWNRIQDELFSRDAESVEPPKAASMGMQNVKGIDAIKQKGKDFENSVEEMYGGFTGEPIIAGNFFAVAMGMDAKMKGMDRMKMDEIAIYEVKDGKIVKEQFFF